MTQGQRFDAVVIGAGILGLAHAYLLAKDGQKVLVLERDNFAVGASIRNFGILGVAGQPIGPRRELAVRSRELWIELLKDAGLEYREAGSLFLAYEEDEWAVLSEYLVQADDPTLGCLLTPVDICRLSPEVRTQGLIGALHCPSELGIDPRTTVRALAAHLAIRYGVKFEFGANVREVASGNIRVNGGSVTAPQIFVCAGSEVRHLFPSMAAIHGLRSCRLQMLRLEPPPFDLGPHLCGGLSLAHFASFDDCPTMPELKTRLGRRFPDQVAHGVYGLAVQHGDGTVTVGDSHEIADTASPFQSAEVDRLILAAVDAFLPISNLAVRERWEGSYPTHPSRICLAEKVETGVHAVAGFGAGMSLSLAIAERVIRGEPIPD